MISMIIFYCVHIFLSISGMTYNKRIMQTESLSAPLTSFLLYKGDLYVGGANKIYILDKDLKQIQIAKTCETAKGVCSKNINKILLAHHSERFQILVSCGTGNSGVCEARNLSNIENVLWSSSASHTDNNYLTVSSNENRPAVGLITENGTFFVALTFGEGVYSSKQNFMKGIYVKTYNYAISSRELSDFLPVTEDFRDKLLKVKISSVPLEEYLIYYKVCFQHEGMSYFVTNQKSEVGSLNYVTKLVRICQDDQGFYSYTDIVLNCNHFGVAYNLIQDVVLMDSEQYFGNKTGKIFIAVFTRGNNPEQASGDSVVCVKEFQKLNDALDFAKMSYIYSCNGTGNESTRYLHDYKTAGVCQNENKHSERVISHDELVCGTTQTYSNAIGNDPVNIQAYFFSSEVSGILTTLAGATYENKSVILFGTSTGILIQTVLWKNFSIIENYKVTVDPGHEIKKICAIGEETIYVMSSERVIKYATTNCSEFKSCEHMVKVKHPLCGWCIYKERATRRYACFNDSRHWIPSFGNCLSMSLEPHALPLSIASNSWNTRVKIRIPNIPVKISNDSYICLFSLQAYIKNITNAVQLDNATFSCLLPNISVTGKVKIKLLVKTHTGFEATLSTALLLIYECRQYKRCMECIDTKFVQCNWCGQDSSCQEPKSGCPSPISVSSKCPQLLDKTDNFLPLGTKTMASFRITNALNLTEVIYRCILPASESVMATLIGDLLSCPLQVMNIGKENKKELKIVITYGPRVERLAEIDDPFANSVTVYRCEQMALDCSHCQALNKSRYSCYWDTNNECVHNGSTRVSNCPSPNITKITPTTGPIHGGTYVTIYGSNLGTTMLDTETITVANVTCDLINDTTIKPGPDFESLVPSRLICKTRSSQTDTKGAVTVVVNGKHSNTNIGFSYKSPNVSSIYPNFGPKAGGTKVTVYGQNLAIGNRKISLFLDNHECDLVNITEEISDAENYSFECIIKCRKDYLCSSNVTELYLTMDGNRVATNKAVWFSFVDDPADVQVSPLTAFVSGGTKLKIEGSFLNNAHSSSIKLDYKGETRVANCEIVSDTNAVCEIPEAPRALKEQLASQLPSATKEKQRCYGRINVSTEINFDAVVRNFTISYTNDPVFDILPAGRNVLTFDSKEPWILISGKCFGNIHPDFDINIKVGDKTCIIINMTQTVISCVAPTVKPRVTSGNKHPEISVTVGNIHVTVGYLRYMSDEQDDVHTMRIVYILVATLFIWIFISGAVFLCRRNRKLKKRVTYLEGKKTNVKRRNRKSHRKTVDIDKTFPKSGMYDEINDEDVLDNPDDIIGGANNDESAGYLVPHPYADVGEVDTFLAISQKESETDTSVDINRDTPSTDQAYIHAIDDVDKDGTEHVKEVKISKVLEKAESVDHAYDGEYIVSFTCSKLSESEGDVGGLKFAKSD